MKNNIKFVALVASLLTFASCSDWTDPDSLDIKNNSLAEQNPALNAAYLQNLKDYKAGEHKVMLVTLDNSTTAPTSQSGDLTALPDSIDYIALNTPDSLSSVMIDQMGKVREKGTRVIYTIDYTTFTAEWQQMQKADPSLTDDDAAAYYTQCTNNMLALCDKYGYDGFIVSYAGQDEVSMDDTARAAYEASQDDFFGLIATWQTANPSKFIAFAGAPQYLDAQSKAFLQQCKYIILPTELSLGTADMAVQADMAIQSGNVPSDRFIFATYTTESDDANYIYGYFDSLDADGNKELSIPATALWIGQASSDFTRSGMLIRRVQYDYYNPTLVYSQTRAAIATMNPSPKN